MRWSKRITPVFDAAYEPVEYAAAGLDPSRDRVYIGTSNGDFYAFTNTGRRVYRYDPEAGVEAAPAVDLEWGEVYLASEDGMVHALRGRDGEVRWKESAGGPVRQTPVLSGDAIYVVTESDQVVALSRESGELLWNYERESEQEFAITGHAGLTLADDKLITGLTDGTVVALGADDGAVIWERPTQIDVDASTNEPIRFFDVDTTPVVDGETVYAASFAAGIYALSLSNGSVEWRIGERTGVTGLALAGRFLIAASADDGLLVLDHRTRELVWGRILDRGSPSQPIVAGPLVIFGESQGSLIAMHLQRGEEVARVEAGTGFSAPVSIAGNLGWVLSNGGSLFAFSL